MSPRGVRRLLWLAAILLVPVPLIGLGSGWVPTAHLFELALLTLGFGLIESMQGVTLALLASFLIPALFYVALLWPLAWGVARVLAPLAPLTRFRAALLIVMLGAGYAIARPVYETPFSSHSAHSTLLGVYR
jgi:hypothetical protein